MSDLYKKGKPTQLNLLTFNTYMKTLYRKFTGELFHSVNPDIFFDHLSTGAIEDVGVLLENNALFIFRFFYTF